MKNLSHIDFLNELNENNKGDTPLDGGYTRDHEEEDENENESRPQIKSPESNPYSINDLTNHELHKVNNIEKQNLVPGKNTILDETLGGILDKTINFMTYSFDGYSMKFTEAELIVDAYENKSWYESLKVHSTAVLLFIRDDENILYIGILLVFLSIIIYFINITTS